MLHSQEMPDWSTTHIDYSVRSDCRLCGAATDTVFDLGATPLANEYPAAPIARGQDVFPLYLVRCTVCAHVQLPVVVEPTRLFRQYAYQSGTSPIFREHLSAFAKDVRPGARGDFVVEFGSNDGTLLREYAAEGFRVLGIDPARNLAEQATASGVPTIAEFFDEDLASEIRRVHGAAELIVANNVFAHADDLSGIARGVATLLSPTGRFVFEVGYLLDVIRDGLFDVVYHEHVSYHHLLPLRGFFERYGLVLYDAHRVPSQGGSVRCFVRLRSAVDDSQPTARLCGLFDHETATGVDARSLKESIRAVADGLQQTLRRHAARGQVVAGFGAPAKLTTLVYACGLGASDLAFIGDDNPLKVGRCTPGQFIPIVSTSELLRRRPDALVIFSWNFAAEIINRCRRSGYVGRIITPMPSVVEL